MGPAVEIVVTGRDTLVPEHLERHAVDKLTRLGCFDRHIIRFDVEMHREQHRHSPAPYRVAITGHGRGPALRAEARGVDLRAALDTAIGRVDGQLRRNHDRQQVHHYRRPSATGPEHG